MTTPQLVCYNGKLITPVYGYGFCECGCGGKPKISPETSMPRRFIHGHQNRLQGPDYEPRDCGFKTPCWIWLKLLDQYGYARITIYRTNRRATRSYYQHYVGTVPDKEHLDHLCRVRSCVNPDHLEPVPPCVNVRRGAKAIYTEDDVKRMAEMRRRGMLYREIAKHFGAKMEYVQAICQGDRWRGALTPSEICAKGRRITPAQVQEVLALRKSGSSAQDIALKMGLPVRNMMVLLWRHGVGMGRYMGRKTTI